MSAKKKKPNQLYNLEAEKAVLGSLLIDPDAWDGEQVQRLTPASFHDTRNMTLFMVIKAMHLDGKPIDEILLADKLNVSFGDKNLVYITTIKSETPSALNCEYYAEIVSRCAAGRRLDIALKNALVDLDASGQDIDADLLAEKYINDIQIAAPRQSIDVFSTWDNLAAHIGPIEWVWPGWLPRGFLVLLAGEQGQGKSILALRIASCFLRGDPWPDGTSINQADMGRVLWVECEEAQGLNIQRARAWNLKLEDILQPTPVDQPMRDIKLDNPRDWRNVQTMARRQDVKLIIIDSLSGANTKDENSNEALQLTKQLAALARDTKKPILLTHHLRKRGILDTDGAVSLDRIRGFSGITQPARVVWALDCPDPMDEETRRLSTIKNNLAKYADPLGFKIDSTGAVVFVPAPNAPKKTTKLEKAIAFLEQYLTSGPKDADACLKEMLEQGIGKSTVFSARQDLQIITTMQGKECYWALPKSNSFSGIVH